MLGRIMLLSLLWISPTVTLAESSLAYWVSNEAAPRLAKLLDEQPRFIGESIEIVAINQGTPSVVDDALTEKLRQELREKLLTISSARLPVHQSCNLTGADVVLGIDVSRRGARDHRVVLALLDLGDNLWINGSSQVWQGRLTAEDRRLLGTRVTSADSGASGYAAVGDLQGCERPAVTAPVETATLTLPPEMPKVPAVIPARQQQLAPLLTDIEIKSRRSYCRGQGRNCVDIEYSLLEDAWVFEFYTRSGQLVPLRCDDLEEMREGERGLGLKVPDTTERGRPALGYYVLATRYFDVAGEVASILHGMDDRCDSPRHEGGLADLAALVSSGDVEWKSLHFSSSRGRVSEFAEVTR